MTDRKSHATTGPTARTRGALAIAPRPRGALAIAPRHRGGWALTLAATLLAGCAVIPQNAPPPVHTPPPAPEPTAALPHDEARHRVALLVPITGPDAAVGTALANATTMALLDMNAQNLRITTYDTAGGATAAAQRAIADGNRLILGPLLGDDARPIADIARASSVPVISFSNDTAVAGGNIYVMGVIPAEAIVREVDYARKQGATRFAALIQVGTFGTRASAAMLAAVRDVGGQMVGMENYPHTPAGMAAAVRRLRAHGNADAVLIADSARGAAQIAPLLARPGAAPPRILGTELWSGESVIPHTPALAGAEFAALSDTRFHRFSESYKARFGTAPYRIATLGYDAVLLTLRVARDWRPGSPFPAEELGASDGFLGLDGPFRFGGDGVVERAFEVREVAGGTINVVSPAPAHF